MKDRWQTDLGIADAARDDNALIERALELWESCGEPDVYDDSIWSEAEHELIAERAGRAVLSAVRFRR